ncbi:MAG: response regulator [Longimicrobiales bacterium]
MSATVLIADDHEDLRVITRALLEHHGYRVIEAVNGSEAVEQARLEQPTVILMDIAMPVMDGVAAAEILRGHPATAAIPIAALTAMPIIPKPTLFDAFLGKPVAIDKLLEAVGRLANGESRRRHDVKRRH